MTLFPNWCFLCKALGESVNHIFIHCKFSQAILDHFCSISRKVRVWPEVFKEFVCQWFSGGYGIRGKLCWDCLPHGVV